MRPFTPFSSETPIETEWDYRAVSPWAVASIVLGVLSVTVALSWFFVFLPLAGLFAGWSKHQ